MGKSFPVLKAREVSQILMKLGFVMVRQKGSHQQYRHPDGRSTTVPFHSADISPVLLRKIVRDIEISLPEFFKHH